MADDTHAIHGRLLARHGRTFADELGADLRTGGASARFRLLVGALLMSAPVQADVALAGANALFAAGFTDARAMLDATWQQRVDALGEGHYVRYDESTATYLAETCQWLLERYDGDLDRLRDVADRDPARERPLIKGAKGIGDVGVDICFRELQAVWTELRPFVDGMALGAAGQLGLGASADELARVAGDDDLSVLTAALVRAKLTDDLEVVRDGTPAPPTATQLAIASKDELERLAREHDVPGRSSMTKDELVTALRGVR